jgi:hypothetical protein
MGGIPETSATEEFCGREVLESILGEEETYRSLLEWTERMGASNDAGWAGRVVPVAPVDGENLNWFLLD